MAGSTLRLTNADDTVELARDRPFVITPSADPLVGDELMITGPAIFAQPQDDYIAWFSDRTARLARFIRADHGPTSASRFILYKAISGTPVSEFRSGKLIVRCHLATGHPNLDRANRGRSRPLHLKEVRYARASSAAALVIETGAHLALEYLFDDAPLGFTPEVDLDGAELVRGFSATEYGLAQFKQMRFQHDRWMALPDKPYIVAGASASAGTGRVTAPSRLAIRIYRIWGLEREDGTRFDARRAAPGVLAGTYDARFGTLLHGKAPEIRSGESVRITDQDSEPAARLDVDLFVARSPQVIRALFPNP